MEPITFVKRRGGYPSPHNWSEFGKHNRDRDDLIPRVDVIDSDRDISIVAELPGIDVYIDISITRIITCYGGEEKEDNHYRCVISRGDYSHTVSLPSELDATEARANFVDDVLILVIPKTEDSKRRSITAE